MRILHVAGKLKKPAAGCCGLLPIGWIVKLFDL
jgi:hypothetical protein